LPTFDVDGRLVAMDIGRPSATFETLSELLSRGHELASVLPVFTQNVAALLRLSHKGRIEVGADADLVSLDDSHRIRHVMLRGRLVVRGGAPSVIGKFEETGPKRVT
jgi:beta-aspartyl-dipeptidase (metallo-type)